MKKIKNLKEQNFNDWNKQENALSNNVFYNDGVYCKKYSKNDFNYRYGNRENELLSLIYPHIILMSNEYVFCTKEIPGKTKLTKDLTNSDIINFSNELKRIHNIKVPKDVADKIGMPNFLLTWDLLVSNKKIPKHKNEEVIFQEGLEIVGEDVVISSNDIVEGNILFFNDEVKIIDYEYGGLNSKYFDIASFIIKRHLTKQQEKLFMDSYFKEEDVDTKKLEIAKNFTKVFWSKWAWFKYFETNNDIYKEIGEWLIKR